MPMWEMAAHEHAITSIAICENASATRVLSSDESEAKVWEMDLGHEVGLAPGRDMYRKE